MQNPAESSLYDRSERLWGSTSQQRLQAGRLVILGATPSSCEAAKNLILPGLRSFTIVDDRSVSTADLGSNFFLEATDEGRNRAEAAVAVLSELSPFAQGLADTRSVSAFISNSCAQMLASTQSFNDTVVIASSDVEFNDLITLSRVVHDHGGTLLHLLLSGFIGVLRTQTGPYFVLQTKPGPDTKVVDLRPLDPFPSLQHFMDLLDPSDERLSPEVHSHIPWFVVLHHALRRWRAANPAKDRPRTPAEWKAVKAIVNSFARYDEVQRQTKRTGNLEEAESWCSERVDLTKRNMPELHRMLNDARAVHPTAQCEVGWFLAHGLRRFMEVHNGYHPVAPDLPDIDCTTEMYKELLRIFRAKAEEDAEELWSYASTASSRVGGPPIDKAYAVAFAASSWEVNFVETTVLADELTAPLSRAAFTNSTTLEFACYVAYRAALLFVREHGRYPGLTTLEGLRTADPYDADHTEMVRIIHTLFPNTGDRTLDDADEHAVKEWVRGGTCEIATTASVMGAIAGQEAIKMLQGMRRPAIQTLVFNGATTAQFVTIGPTSST